MMSNIAYNGETIGNRTCIIQWKQQPVYDTLDLTAKAPGTFGDDFLIIYLQTFKSTFDTA